MVLERDPHLLTTPVGSIVADSTYSIGNFICQTLSNLAAHPKVLYSVQRSAPGKRRPRAAWM